MDYDQYEIAQVYDAGRNAGPAKLRQWLERIAAHVPAQEVAQIVDFGCGTGRFSQALAEYFDADVLGLDPSEKMLQQARRKTVGERVTFRRISGENIDVSDESVDLVFMSMVFHHLPEPLQTIRACHRALRSKGYVCIRNGTADAIESFPKVRFFPGAETLLTAQLPSRRQIEAVFESAGFRGVAHEIVVQETARDWTEYAQQARTRADSTLAGMPDEDFHAGMAALEGHIARTGPEGPIREDIDFFVFQR